MTSLKFSPVGQSACLVASHYIRIRLILLLLLFHEAFLTGQTASNFHCFAESHLVANEQWRMMNSRILTFWHVQVGSSKCHCIDWHALPGCFINGNSIMALWEQLIQGIIKWKTLTQRRQTNTWNNLYILYIYIWYFIICSIFVSALHADRTATPLSPLSLYQTHYIQYYAVILQNNKYICVFQPKDLKTQEHTWFNYTHWQPAMSGKADKAPLCWRDLHLMTCFTPHFLRPSPNTPYGPAELVSLSTLATNCCESASPRPFSRNVWSQHGGVGIITHSIICISIL